MLCIWTGLRTSNVHLRRARSRCPDVGFRLFVVEDGGLCFPVQRKELSIPLLLEALYYAVTCPQVFLIPSKKLNLLTNSC